MSFPSRQPRVWTGAESSELRRLYFDGDSIEHLAALFGCTSGEIVAQTFILGLRQYRAHAPRRVDPLPAGPVPDWPRIVSESIRLFRESKLDTADIARRLDQHESIICRALAQARNGALT